MRLSRSSFSLRRAVVACSAVAALSGAAGCAGTVSGSGVGSVRRADMDRIQGPFAPPGQRFAIQLDQPIDTVESLRRGTFTARLVNPILANDGSVIAPVGAVVRGTVRSLGSIDAPRVSLRFDSVDTVRGPAELPARIRQAQYRTYPGPLVTVPVTGYSGYYGTGPYGGLGWGGGPGYGYYGGPGYGFYGGGYWDYVTIRPREVHMPAGARLDLELRRPLVPPGSTVRPR